MAERFNSGPIPGSRYSLTYEDLADELAIFHASLAVLGTGSDQDRSDFGLIAGTLNGFSLRHKVQPPTFISLDEDSIQPVRQEWNMAALHEALPSWGKDYNVGRQPGTEDARACVTFAQTVLRVMDRHGVLTARVVEEAGVIMRLTDFQFHDRERYWLPLRSIMQPNTPSR